MSPALTVAPTAPRAEARAGFEELYRTSRDDVYAYVAALLRDPSTAEDVVALAFERAYRKRSGWDARRGSQRAWIFTIARNAALDELRRRKRSAALTAGLSNSELARVLGVSESNAGTLLHRTIEKLRKACHATP